VRSPDANRTMSLQLTKLHRRLRARLWFWPGIVAVTAFVTARALVGLDRREGWKRDTWYLFGGSAQSARELLSTVSSAMITFTGLVFSITILVLQLASAQFSPRVLRTFLEDRRTQTAMAAFVGTFVYTLAVLPLVRSADDRGGGFVPGLALFVAFVLVLVSVAVFIGYIDHMAHSIRAISLVQKVGRETRAAIEHMYPERLTDEHRDDISEPTSTPHTAFHDGRAGVLAAVDEDALLAAACRAHAVVALVPAPGEFVPSGAPLFRYWGGDDALADAVRAAVSIEDERTPQQDPAFGFRQLVDVAERALSPGVNDPSTAVQVLDELHDLLRQLATRQFPSSLAVDPAGALRLVLPRPSWDDYVRLALDEITHYGAGSLQVMVRIRSLVADCLSIAPASRRAALEAQFVLLDEVVSVRHDPAVKRALSRR
jgi:uncharacterized membrane protein